MAAVRKALLQIARDMGIPTARYPAPADGQRDRTRVEPCAIDLAVLAVAAESALELIASEQVCKARDHDEYTWERIGYAFGTSAQSAHVRFGRAATSESRAGRARHSA